MENLLQVAPSQIAYSDPIKAPLSSSKIVSIRPTSGNSVGSSSTSASSTDSITFKLPSNGMLKTGSMYLKYNVGINTSAGSTGGKAVVGAVLGDEFSPDSAVFSRMKVFSSDGTEISHQSNYGAYCSVMNRLKKARGELESRGSILNGSGLGYGESLDESTTKVNEFAYSHLALNGNAQDANALNIGVPPGLARNYRILSQQSGLAGGGGAVDSRITSCVHQIQGGLLDHNESVYLPTFALGAGLTLEMGMADVKDAVKVVCANAVDAQGGTNICHTDATAKYFLTDIELIAELTFYDNSVLSSVNNLLCQGIKIRHPRVKSQVNSISSQESTIQMSEHGRSINAVICGLRNTTQNHTLQNFSNDFQYKVDGTNFPVSYQAQCGSEVIPSSAVKVGSQSAFELERAVSGGDSKFRLGNCINASSYFKTAVQAGAGANELVSGDCLFGVSFMSHGDKPALMSGKTSSAGSIPLSFALNMNSTPSNCELMSFVISDQITELLHDGSVVISR